MNNLTVSCKVRGLVVPVVWFLLFHKISLHCFFSVTPMIFNFKGQFSLNLDLPKMCFRSLVLVTVSDSYFLQLFTTS